MESAAKAVCLVVATEIWKRSRTNRCSAENLCLLKCFKFFYHRKQQSAGVGWMLPLRCVRMCVCMCGSSRQRWGDKLEDYSVIAVSRWSCSPLASSLTGELLSASEIAEEASKQESRNHPCSEVHCPPHHHHHHNFTTTHANTAALAVTFHFTGL